MASDVIVEPNREREPARELRFSLREWLLLVVVAGLAMGWWRYSEIQRARAARQQKQSEYATLEAEAEQDRASLRWASAGARHGALTVEDMTGKDLSGTTIGGSSTAMQLAVFDDANLEGSSMSGSFQGARFDKARMARAKLTGDASSFQYASFVGADLTGATLVGAGGAFQRATFRGATMVDARVICGGAGFQLVNIDGVRFEGADLSAIDAKALTSCYFSRPPTYNATTKFPAEFDAAAEGWEYSR